MIAPLLSIWVRQMTWLRTNMSRTRSGSGERSSGSLSAHSRQYASVRSIMRWGVFTRTLSFRPSTASWVWPAASQQWIEPDPHADSATAKPTVESTEPCAIACRESRPSSASRQVPSASPMRLAPVAQ